MRGFIQLLVLSFVVFLASASFAQMGQDDESESESEAKPKVAPESERVQDDDGPVFIGETAYLALDSGDYLLPIRGAIGYTFPFGLQLGGHLTGYYLNRPSVAEKPETMALDDSFVFWGVGPMVGWDLELVEDWIGIELMALPSFPITNYSTGWSIEVAGNAYFSFEGVSSGSFDLALMGGIRFCHVDFEADGYAIERNQMMPGGGIMGQF